jgi:hypothetical protein
VESCPGALGFGRKIPHVNDLPDQLARRIQILAANRDSGASELLDEVILVLRDALTTRVPIAPLARAVCRAQPGMGPVWNAALAALSGAEAFERFAQRVARGPAALTRFAAECLGGGAPGEPLHLVTLSFSRSVAIVLEGLARSRSLRVACAEGRPALEGRRLASRLAAAGTPVTCFSDASIAHALAGADAVLVGADAVAPEWFFNKSGTRMLAAAAGLEGVPVYVAATRDKFVSRDVAARLANTEGAPAEIWERPPAGVAVRNPYFETAPLDLVTGVISDLGILGVGMIGDVCAEADDGIALRMIEDGAR